MSPAGWGVVLLGGAHGWIGSQPVEPSYKASLLPHPAPNVPHVPAGTTPTFSPTLGWQEARVQNGTGPQKVLENPDTQQGGLSSSPGQVLGFGHKEWTGVDQAGNLAGSVHVLLSPSLDGDPHYPQPSLPRKPGK